MKWAIYNVTVALLLVSVWLAGVLDFIHDETGMVWLIAAVAVMGAICARYARPWLEWLCDAGVPVLLGLLGTVAGFIMAIQGIQGDAEAAKISGVGTALSTTAVGLVAHLYLILMERVTR